MFFLLFSDLPSPLATSAPTCSPFWALSAVLPSQALCRTQRRNDRGVWKRLTTLQYYLLLQDITVNPGSPLLFTTALFSFWGNSALAAAWNEYLSCCYAQAQSQLPLPVSGPSVSHLSTCIPAWVRAARSCSSLLLFPHVSVPFCQGLIPPFCEAELSRGQTGSL